MLTTNNYRTIIFLKRKFDTVKVPERLRKNEKKWQSGKKTEKINRKEKWKQITMRETVENISGIYIKSVNLRPSTDPSISPSLDLPDSATPVIARKLHPPLFADRADRNQKWLPVRWSWRLSEHRLVVPWLRIPFFSFSGFYFVCLFFVLLCVFVSLSRNSISIFILI